MAKKYINDTFWSDNYIERISPDHKLIFLFLLTNPLCNLAGVYEITAKRIGFGTGYDPDVVEVVLQKFEKDHKIKRIDDWIILVNHRKNQSFNPSMITGLEKIVAALPENIRNIYNDIFKDKKIIIEDEEDTPAKPKREKKIVVEVQLELPAWVNKDVWNEWVEFRRVEKKKPLSEKAIKMQLKELEEYKQEHVKIIQHSIKNDYQGLFPDKFKKDADMKGKVVLQTADSSDIVKAMQKKAEANK
jgi:hypothetical protein